MIRVMSFPPSLASFPYRCHPGFPMNIKLKGDRARAMADIEYLLARGNERIPLTLVLAKVLVGIFWIIVQLSDYLIK